MSCGNLELQRLPRVGHKGGGKAGGLAGGLEVTMSESENTGLSQLMETISNWLPTNRVKNFAQ